MKVSVNECKLKKGDVASVNTSLKQGWYSSAGPIVPKFESLWANFCNRKFGVAVSNGTTGLIAAVYALGLKKNDEVIVPNFTIISCGLAIKLAGATMVPVDCEIDTFNIDIEKLKLSINKNTKAILVVHIYGQPARMSEILQIAKEHNLKIIEDSAEAHGAEYLSNYGDQESWKRCGSQGDLSVFSFFANKLISTGEGGMVVTNDIDLAEKLEQIRNLGFSKDRSYVHEHFGLQFRMTSMQAALGIPQIARMEKILKKKQEMHLQYKNGLEDLKKVRFQEESNRVKSCYWVNAIVLDSKMGIADDVRKSLLKYNIETRPFFVGMNRQPIYKEEKFYQSDQFPNSDHISKQGLILPSGLATTQRQINHVIRSLKEILN
jgi:perosamine synthetase